MAGICKKCGANVGCSCQLKDGLCPACYGALTKFINFCKYVIS